MDPLNKFCLEWENIMVKQLILIFFSLALITGNASGMQITNSIFQQISPKTGFLVLAPDRGFVGNNETLSIFQNFEKEYLSKIIFVGRKYDGLNSNYSKYFQKALSSFDELSVSKVVILPLFLSKYNHILQEVRKNIPAYNFKGQIHWNETMSESYLTTQILFDRVKKISSNPNQEKLVILGRGALDEKSEQLMKKELEELSDYIKQREVFKSIQVGIYYSYNAKDKLRVLKEGKVNDMVIHTAAKKGKTLVIPFFIGPKYSNMMSLTHFFDRRFKDITLFITQKKYCFTPISCFG